MGGTVGEIGQHSQILPLFKSESSPVDNLIMPLTGTAQQIIPGYQSVSIMKILTFGLRDFHYFPIPIFTFCKIFKDFLLKC